MALLQQLNAQGMTVVVVTHEREIAEFAKRIVLFRDGRVVEDHAVERPRDAAALAAELKASQPA
jgi:putative ABC transport system ATP-binding protein